MPPLYYDTRDRHLHVIGKTGFGKTTLLTHQVVSDFLSGEGSVVVLDAKGDVTSLAELVCRMIPEDRIEDCVWIDMDNPLPLDFMSCAPGQEETVVNDLKYILMKGMTDSTYAPTLMDNVENLLYTFIDANKHPDIPKDERCTLLDVYRFFKEPDRKATILRFVTDAKLQADWSDPKAVPPPDQARIIHRISPFMNSPVLRKALGDPNPELNIHDLLYGPKPKILLVSLPDTQPTALDYGSFILAKIQAAAFSRIKIPKNERRPVFLYIDEFQELQASEKFDKMLGKARSFKLCLTLSHLRLTELDKNVRDALGLVSSRIVFQPANGDEHALAPYLNNPPLTTAVNPPYPADDDAAGSANSYRLLELLDAGDQEGFIDFSLKMHKERTGDSTYEYSEVITETRLRQLGKYEAVYKLDDAPVVIEPIPDNLPDNPAPEQAAKIKRIKERSVKRYGAQNDTNAPKAVGDNATCNSAPVSHSKGNANGDEHEPEPQGAIPYVPRKPHKTKGPRNRR